MIFKEIPIFKTSAIIEGAYDSLFGGLFQRVGTPEWAQMCLILGIFSMCVLLVAHLSSHKQRFGWAAIVAAHINVTLIVYLINQPWDELFVNLRHSLHWAENNFYSFNRFEPIEAIVDFLPYFLIGTVAKVGIEPLSLALFQSWLGAILCGWAGFYTAGKLLGRGPFQTLAFVVLSLYPPLCFNASQGFATTIFAASILWTIALLFVGGRRRSGLLLLSIVPLIRLEGALFAVMAIAVYGRQQYWNRSFWKSAPLVFLPIAALSLARLQVFGSAVPIPVIYKSTFPNLTWLRLGIRSFLTDLISSYSAVLTILLGVLYMMPSQRWMREKRFSRALWAPLGILFLFSLPYYLSGGDWFPSSWSRYLLPFGSFLLLAFTVSFVQSWRLGDAKTKRFLGFSTAAAFGLLFAIPVNLPMTPGVTALINALFAPTAGKGQYRIQELSRVGNHLKKLLDEKDSVASSEVGTVMYFSRREGLDLLGVANREIASAPLLDTGNAAFRRRKPEVLNEKRPTVLWPYDFTSFCEFEDPAKTILEKANERLVAYGRANDFRFGSYEYLTSIGYRPVVVLYGNNFSTLYFVERSAYNSHFRNLIRNGFTRVD